METAAVLPDQERPRLQRRSDRRVIAGLSAGIGDAIAVDPAYVRAAFIVLSLAGGIGLVLYGLGWLLTIDSTTGEPAPALLEGSTSEIQRAIGFQLTVIGVMAFATSIDLTLHPSIVWPTSLVVLGVANVWAHGDDQARDWLAGILPGSEAAGTGSSGERIVRLVIGGALAAGGIILAVTTTNTFAGAGIVVVSVSLTLLGLFIVLGPWFWRLWRQLADERRERIRSEEKTEIAAHLHDSVLQTLALIQASSDPQQQAVLARIQERELRSYLFGGDGGTAGTLKALLEAAATEVERTHKVAVEVVTVGDVELDNDVAALVAATREALINSAKHSGERTLSLFGEVDERTIDVFVTDQGKGFEPGTVDGDRHGISESIVGRMERHGGTAIIESQPGNGTEVHLSLPRRTTP